MRVPSLVHCATWDGLYAPLDRWLIMDGPDQIENLKSNTAQPCVYLTAGATHCTRPFNSQPEPKGALQLE